MEAADWSDLNSSVTLTAARWKTLWLNGGRSLVGPENASSENSTTLDVEATKQVNSSLTLTAARWKTLWWNGGRRLVGPENAASENSTTLDVEAMNRSESDALWSRGPTLADMEVLLHGR